MKFASYFSVSFLQTDLDRNARKRFQRKYLDNLISLSTHLKNTPVCTKSNKTDYWFLKKNSHQKKNILW